MISESLDEILAVSDRIVGLYNGRVTGELSRDQANVERVGCICWVKKRHDGRPVVRFARAHGNRRGAPFALAIAIGAVVLAATGHEPLAVYQLMIEEAFGGERRIAATLTAATPLLLTASLPQSPFAPGSSMWALKDASISAGWLPPSSGTPRQTGPPRPHSACAPRGLVVGGAWLIGPGLLRARSGSMRSSPR